MDGPTPDTWESRERAAALARRIEAYWRARGAKVTARLTKDPTWSSQTNPDHWVRSDMLGGLPLKRNNGEESMSTTYRALMGNGRTLELRLGERGSAVQFRFDSAPRWRPSVACQVGDGTPLEIARRIAGNTRTVISIEIVHPESKGEQHETD